MATGNEAQAAGVTDVNLSKTYTVKSNATRDMKKAIAKGELPANAEVVVVPSGYQIVLPYVAPAKPAVTPQVPALNGMAPMGFMDVALSALREGFNPAKADALLSGNVGVDAGKKAKPAAAPQADQKDCAALLAAAVADVTKTVAWTLFDDIREAAAAQGLTTGQLAPATGAARKRGLIETEWSNVVGLTSTKKIAIRVTAAGLAAHQGSN
jgi:hypothetical protein